MTPQELRERTRVFALRAVRWCRTVPSTEEARDIAGQLRRAAMAVAANYRSSCRARSRVEFAARIGIVLEEIDESDHWIGTALDLGIGEPGENKALKKEAEELCAIFGRSYQTARAPRWQPRR
jgi:four helix bundle protein